MADDERILGLFREWTVAEREAAAISRRNNRDDDDDDPEEAAARNRADAILEEIAETAATGMAGLSIKFYLALRGALCAPYHDPCAIIFEEGTEGEFMGKAALRDAARLVPELAPLCAPVLAEASSEG
jgi:hypothetical protein